MTLVHNEQQTVDLEQEDKVDTIVAGLRYTGPKSTAPPTRPRRQGGWPGRASFQGGPVAAESDDGTVAERDPGPIQIGIIPDRIDSDYVEGGTLPGLETLSDFEVVYDPAELAGAILNGNYLPANVFGAERTAPDYDVRERVVEALDLPDSLGTAGSPNAERRIREALAETAGVDLDDEEPADASREIEYRNEYTRSDLYHAAQELDRNVEWATATKTEMAALLAQESPGDVRDALPDE